MRASVVVMIVAATTLVAASSFLLTDTEDPELNPVYSHPNKVLAVPIWPITEDGTTKQVEWIDADNPRFAVYDNGTSGNEEDDIVLDKETGLVWQRSPDNQLLDWSTAFDEAYNHHIVNLDRKGWRLPLVEELESLVKPYVDPSLPAGHPFINVQSSAYWTATTRYWYYPVELTQSRNNYAYIVHMNNGSIWYDEKNTEHSVWFVRGGVGTDGL